MASIKADELRERFRIAFWAKGEKVVGNDARINDSDTSGTAIVTSVMEMEILAIRKSFNLPLCTTDRNISQK